MEASKLSAPILGAFVLILGTLALPGCQMQPLREKPTAEAAAVQNARTAIDEANAALTALNTVIAQNAVDGVWTKAQAQSYLDKSKGYGKQADQARALLRAGDPLKAENQAKLLRQAILVLHREIAQQARGKP